MKKAVFCSIAMLCAMTISAQYNAEYVVTPYWSVSNTYFYYPRDDQALIRNCHVKEKRLIRICRHKEKIISITKFNSDGRVRELTVFNWSFGKARSSTTFIPAGRRMTPDCITRNSKNEETARTSYKYNSDTLLTEFIDSRHGKIYSRTTNTYDSTRVIESCYYRKDMTVPYKRWVYEYYPDHSRKSSTLFCKGKIKYVWNYDCSDAGTLVQKHKDTTTVCQNTEFDQDSNRTVTTRRFDEKGVPHKQVIIYNRKNTVIEQCYYYKDDVPQTRYKWDPDKLTYCWTNYDRHGVEIRKHLYILDQDKKAKEIIITGKGNKLITQTVNTYNDKGLVTEKITRGSKGQIKMHAVLLYSDQGLLISEKTLKGHSNEFGLPEYRDVKYTYLF